MGVECHRILGKEKKTQNKKNHHTKGYPFCNREITTLYLCKDLKTMRTHSKRIYLITL